MWPDVLMAGPGPPWLSVSQIEGRAVSSRTEMFFTSFLSLTAEPFEALHFMFKAHLEVDSFKSCLTH